MNISYDPDKNEKNIVERGISFERAAEFEWSSALIVEDTRKDYGESRLHALVFTPRAGQVHVISLRKANRREVKRYETQTQP